MTTQSVPAVQYERTTCVAGMHNETIKEIFIPSIHVRFNSRGEVHPADKPLNVSIQGNFHVIVNPLTDIEISKTLFDKIASVAKMKLALAKKEERLQEYAGSFWEKNSVAAELTNKV